MSEFEEWQKLMRKAINLQNGIASEDERQAVAEALLRRLDGEGFSRMMFESRTSAAAKAVAKELWHTDPDRPFTDEAWDKELQLLDKYRDEPDFIRDNLYASKCFRIAAAVLKTVNFAGQRKEQ